MRSHRARPHGLIRRLPALLAAAALLAGCGATYHSGKGRDLLAAGRHDEAIRRFEQAVAAVKDDPAQAPKYRAELTAARAAAAHHHIALGDKALDQKDLAGTAAAYRKARAYAPTDALVVQKLSSLLKLRLRIEGDLKRAEGELEVLSKAAGDPAAIAKWNLLIRQLEGLQVWRRDYPQSAELLKKARAPAAKEFLANARQLAAVEKFDDAIVQVGKSLKLAPADAGARALQTRLLQRGQADRIARSADDLLAKGDTTTAIATYKEALAADANSHAAREGLREARRQHVAHRLAEVKTLTGNKDARGALMAVRDARAVGTEDSKQAKKLAKLSAKLHAQAAKRHYKAGRRHEKKRRHGAALISYRIATALEGKQKDLPRRLTALEKTLSRAASYSLYFASPSVPKHSWPKSSQLLVAGFQQRLAAAGMDKVNLTVVSDRRARRRADGTLTMGIERFELRRSERQAQRSRKYLDRVEFPPNPKWAIGQREQSAALASLNHSTDILRPKQRELEKVESSLQELQSKFVELKKKIAAEDGAWYANPTHKTPCKDGSTRCKGTRGHRRWAKHVTYYETRIAKANKKLKTITPDYKAALAEVASRQNAFDEAEVTARETSKKLRQEIWLDWSYEVTMHNLATEATVTMEWHDRMAGRKLADETRSIHKTQIDYSTAPVIIKKQTLEATRTSQLPGDDAVAMEMTTRLLDGLMPTVLQRLRGHGLRYVIAAADARGDDGRLDALVRALSAGAALDDKVRANLAAEVLKRTGWDWVAKAYALEKTK